MLCTASNFKSTIENNKEKFKDYKEISKLAHKRREEVENASLFTQFRIFFLEGDYDLPKEFLRIADAEALKAGKINEKLKKIVGEEQYNKIVQEVEEETKQEKEQQKLANRYSQKN